MPPPFDHPLRMTDGDGRSRSGKHRCDDPGATDPTLPFQGQQARRTCDGSQNCEVRTFAWDSWWLREVGLGVCERLNDGFQSRPLGTRPG
jgi:hypothetical protein